MKKKLISAILCAALAVSMLAGCGSSDKSSGEQSTNAPAAASEGAKTIAIVPKSAGNPYNEKEVEGFKEVVESAGDTCIVQYPDAATADAQITVITFYGIVTV